MTTKCPKCNEEYEVEENSMGSELECSKCDNVFVAKQKLSLKRSIQPAQVAEDEEEDEDEIEEEYVPSHLRNMQKNDEIEVAPLGKSILYLGGLGLGAGILAAICAVLTPWLGVTSSVFAFLFMVVGYFLFDTLMLFLAARVLGPKDLTPKMAVRSSLQVIKLTLLWGIPYFLISFFIPFLFILIWLSPAMFGFLIPIKVYKENFGKNTIEALIITILKNVFTSIIIGILTGVFALITALFALIAGGTDLVSDMASTGPALTKMTFGSGPTIKLSNYDRTYPNGYDGKGIPHIENLATVSDALNLFRKEGMPPKPDVNIYNLAEKYSSFPCKTKKLGKNILKYATHPAGPISKPSTEVISMCYLELRLDDSKASRNKKDIKTFLEYAEKISQFMLKSPLPSKIIKDFNAGSDSDKTYIFENEECKIDLTDWGNMKMLSINYNTIHI